MRPIWVARSLTLAGFALAAVGFGLVYPPAGVIVAGVGLGVFGAFGITVR